MDYRSRWKGQSREGRRGQNGRSPSLAEAPLRKVVPRCARLGTFPSRPLKGVCGRMIPEREYKCLLAYCARATRGLRKMEGAARCPSCSQNAHDETVLVRCAQSRAALATPLHRGIENRKVQRWSAGGAELSEKVALHFSSPTSYRRRGEKRGPPFFIERSHRGSRYRLG